MLKKFFATAGLMFALCACGSKSSESSVISQESISTGSQLVSAQDPAVVSFVDVSRYVGLWYEIASIPQSFQSFCQFTTAEYAVLSPTRISVANKCRVGFVPVSIFGTADVVDTSSNAILEVSFNNVSRKGDYRIVALADDYSYALVTNAARDALFVLSRTNQLDEQIYAALLKRAADVGVDISQVKKTKQQ
jgi:apolipoprotein D and lipocalin family protein